VYYGPDSLEGVPGVRYRTAVPCRFVLADWITQHEIPDSGIIGWVTHDLPQINVPTPVEAPASTFTNNVLQADRVAIPTGTAPRWYAWRSEVIETPTQPVYTRVSLILIPPAAPPPLLLGVTAGSGSILMVPSVGTPASAFVLVTLTDTGALLPSEWTNILSFLSPSGAGQIDVWLASAPTAQFELLGNLIVYWCVCVQGCSVVNLTDPQLGSGSPILPLNVFSITSPYICLVVYYSERASTITPPGLLLCPPSNVDYGGGGAFLAGYQLVPAGTAPGPYPATADDTESWCAVSIALKGPAPPPFTVIS
jgi:hypothetical protein